MVGGWGNQSAASTRMLEALHYRGKLKVVRRVERRQGLRAGAVASGGRAFGATRGRAAEPAAAALCAVARAVVLAARAHGHRELRVAESMRARAFARVCAAEYDGDGDDRRRAVALARRASASEAEPESRVRAFAPFDPAVWDRRRFAAFWGWEYRLEAYTPPAQAGVRLLRAAARVARRCGGLGECGGGRRNAGGDDPLREARTEVARLHPRARGRVRAPARIRRRRAASSCGWRRHEPREHTGAVPGARR